MKVITYEDWMKNPTPRIMWVWSEDEPRKKKKVIYFLERNVSYPVIALDDDDIGISVYEHCAEIPKQRRMTNKELSRWLRENPTREFKYNWDNASIRSYLYYYESNADKVVDDTILIRENDSEWREPLIEEE